MSSIAPPAAGDRALLDNLPPLFADLLQLKGVAVALWFIVFIVAERLLPAAPRPARWRVLRSQAATAVLSPG
jgi:hypothetical protein